MKLIIAIIQNNDAKILMDDLISKGFGVTKMATTGGFLKIKNITLLIGVEEKNLDIVINHIKKICKPNKKSVNSSKSSYSISSKSNEEDMSLGKATIFVVDINKFEKI
jgi:uncharacterized protein YaaQ